MAGRQHRERVPHKSKTRSTHFRQHIHSDFIGPMQQPSLGGSRYTLIFTYDYSRKSWVFFLKHKSETLAKFLIFKQQIENETGHKIQVLCIDQGGEYLFDDFTDLCNKSDIRRELTQANSLQQNGVSKRRNRTIMEKARSISHNCNLPKFLWTEAISHATQLVNRSPTRPNNGITPEVQYTGTISDISNLRIFGCIALMYIPKENRRKLDSRSMQCLFLGFDGETKAYRLFDRSRQKVLISHDVVFDESLVGYQFLSSNESTHVNLIIPNLTTIDQPREAGEASDFPDLTNEPTPTEIDLPEQNFKPIEPSPLYRDPNQTSIHKKSLQPGDQGPSRTTKSPRPANRLICPSVRQYFSKNRAPSTRMKDF